MKKTILEDHAAHVEAWRAWRAWQAIHLQNSLLEFFRRLSTIYASQGNANEIAKLNAEADLVAGRKPAAPKHTREAETLRERAQNLEIADQRARLVASLNASAEMIDLAFLGGGGPLVAAIELRGLARSLDDLGRGVPCELLKRANARRAGRTPDSANVWMMRADVVIAAEYMSADGRTLNAIVGQFLAKHPKIKKLLRKNTAAQTCIKGWRTALLSKSEALGRAENIEPFPVAVAEHFRSSMGIAQHCANDIERSKQIANVIIAAVSAAAR